MNPCSKGERNRHPVATSGLSRSFHQLQTSQTEQNGSVEKAVRIKRRRTRRERNCVRFGRNGTDRVLEQGPGCRGLPKALPPFWRAQLTNCAKPASFKGISGAKPVVITQNRLSQHLGMFNKEVKSVNIERLLNHRCEQASVEVSPLRRDSGTEMQMGEENQTGKSGGSDQKSIPCEQLGSSVNNPSETNEDSLPIAVPPISAVVTEQSSRAPVNAMDPGSPSSAAAGVDQESELQTVEADDLEAEKEKENIPPISPAGAESHKGKSLARNLACDLKKILDLKAIFPGRNLINETRQTIISALLEQKRKLPDFSSLARYKKLAGSSESDAVQADFKTPVGRDQELQLELKPHGDSRNSGRGVSLKRRRGQDVFFLTSPSPIPVHTAVRMDEERPSLREDVDFFAEPDESDRQNFCLAAVQHPPLLSSRHLNSTAESFLASEGQYPLQELWPWEQGLSEALRKSQSRQERTKAVCRPLQKKSAPQRHCLPLSSWDFSNSACVSTDDRCTRQFPVADSQQYPYINELQSEQWSFPEAQPGPGHSLHLSQEQCDSQSLGVGFRPTEGAASEPQTSFDVLKSIWSPNIPSSRTRCPMLQYPGYPFSSYLKLNSDQEEFLQLCSVNPERNCSSPRQNPQQEIRAPSRRSANGHWVFSGPAIPRTCQKVALEPGKTSNSYQLWGPTGASVGTQATREKGRHTSRTQTCSWERLSQMEGLPQLRLLQQLPMSYFPPSEVLEKKYSPLHTLQGHLLGQSSPEPWAFPRMKLY